MLCKFLDDIIMKVVSVYCLMIVLFYILKYGYMFNFEWFVFFVICKYK